MNEPVTSFKNRLNEAMELRNMKPIELAEKCNISKSAVSHYMSGYAEPKSNRLYTIARALNVKETWLMGYDTAMDRNPDADNFRDYAEEANKRFRAKQKGVKINVYSRVAAGVPIEMIEDIVDTEEITEDLAHSGTYFGVKISGDSMIPNICDGDTVIVRQQEDAETGDTVIATVNGSDATCKRLRKYKEGIELIANNPMYEPMYFSNKDIEEKPVRIIGKVVELRRKF